MGAVAGRSFGGYTLIEILLVTGLLVLLTAIAVPNLLADIESRRLPTSARNLRSMLTMVRAHAMYDGKRYRVRFPEEGELDPRGGRRQPIIEREDDPFGEPNIWNRVSEPWARAETFLRNVRCAEVRLGRPTLEKLMDRLRADKVDERLEALADEFEPGFASLIFESDGTTEWATFVVTDGPEDVAVEDLEVKDRIEVILDGLTGLMWLQRPFYDDELDMFKKHDWPPVLRKDFVRTEPLTEQDVLEISETAVRR